jgi:hypothetical protein
MNEEQQMKGDDNTDPAPVKDDDNTDPAPLKDVDAQRVPSAEREKELQNEPPTEGGGAPGEAAQT